MTTMKPSSLFTSSLLPLWLCLGLLATAADGADNQEHLIKQGGIRILHTGRTDLASARLGQVRLPVTSSGLVLTPVHMDTEPGAHEVVLVDTDGKETVLDIEVEARTYREERLQIADQRKVEPEPEDIARFMREAARQKAVYDSFSDLEALPFPMQQPVQGRRSSEFGVRRFFNDQPRSPHSGLDIAAPTGTSIIAPAAGKVALTGDFFFSGLLVMIDHGAGIVSMLGHMSEILVEQDQEIAQGALVGKVGATGRATGPHVHWTLSVGGVRVDPEIALEL